MEILTSIGHNQSKALALSRYIHSVSEVKASKPSYSRYRYTTKIRRELLNRYNTLMKDVGDGDWPELKEIDDKPETDSFIIIRVRSEKEDLSDIMSVTYEVRKSYINETDNSQINDSIQRGEKTMFFTTSNQGIPYKTQEAWQSTIVVLVVKDKDVHYELSKSFSDMANVYVCLREEVEQIISTHLERCALTGMKDVCEFLQAAILAPDCFKDIKRKKTSLLELCKETKEIKERTERLIDEIIGMFNRSNLPKDEHPSLCSAMQQSVNEKLLQDLQSLSKSIKSCRYRFSTFEVCVDGDKVQEKLKCDIEEKLKAYHITDYSIISSSTKLFATVQVGSKVSAGLFTGTLGGFAQTPEEKSSSHWVLTARHLASSDGKLYIEDGGQSFTAKVMEELKDYQPNETYLDIAAASLEEGVENNCDTRYITEDNKRVKGRLCEYDNEKLRGLPVHICGASTKLGLGTITIAKQHSVQPDGVDENYIVVEDRETEEKETRDSVKFCKEGDSGAIVCAECPDNYGEEVQLISMVAGEELNKEGSYQTVRLDKGLEELSTLARKNFELC